MGKYLDIAKKLETHLQAESGLLEGSSPAPTSSPVSSSASPTWPCSYCGKPAVIDEVCSSLDGQRTLTLWHCPPCQTYGVTPDAIRQPPVWVKKKEQ